MENRIIGNGIRTVFYERISTDPTNDITIILIPGAPGVMPFYIKLISSMSNWTIVSP